MKLRTFDVDFLSDEIICKCIDKIDYVYVEGGMDKELELYVSKAMIALYEARDTVFGGVFPFPFEKAHELLCYLPNRKMYWLNTIIHYVPEHYSDEDDEFSLIPVLRSSQWKRGRRFEPILEQARAIGPIETCTKSA